MAETVATSLIGGAINVALINASNALNTERPLESSSSSIPSTQIEFDNGRDLLDLLEEEEEDDMLQEISTAKITEPEKSVSSSVPVVEKPVEKPAEKSVEKPAEKSVEKSDAKTTVKIVAKPTTSEKKVEVKTPEKKVEVKAKHVTRNTKLEEIIQNLVNNKEKPFNVLFVGKLNAGKTTMIATMQGESTGPISNTRATIEAEINIETTDYNKEIFKYSEMNKGKDKKEIDLSDGYLKETVHYVNPSVDFGTEMVKHGYKMVSIDVPGLDDSKLDEHIQEYICSVAGLVHVIVYVVDGNNTFQSASEQKVLNFIIDTIKDYKSVRLIIAVNKVDRPDDDDVKDLVTETETVITDLIGNKIEKNRWRHVTCSAKFAYLYKSVLTKKGFDDLSDQNIRDLILCQFGREKWNEHKSDRGKLLTLLLESLKTKPDDFKKMTGYDKLTDVFDELVVKQLNRIYKEKIEEGLLRRNLDSVTDFEKILEFFTSMLEFDKESKSDYLMKVIEENITSVKKNIQQSELECFDTIDEFIDNIKIKRFNQLLSNHRNSIGCYANVDLLKNKIYAFYVDLLMISSSRYNDYLDGWMKLIQDCHIIDDQLIVSALTQFYSVEVDDKKNHVRHYEYFDFAIEGSILVDIINSDIGQKHDCRELLVTFLDNVGNYCFDKSDPATDYLELDNGIYATPAVMIAIIREFISENEIWDKTTGRKIDRVKKYFKKFHTFSHVNVSESLSKDVINHINKLKDEHDTDSLLLLTVPFLNDFMEYVVKYTEKEILRKEVDSKHQEKQTDDYDSDESQENQEGQEGQFKKENPNNGETGESGEPGVDGDAVNGDVVNGDVNVHA